MDTAKEFTDGFLKVTDFFKIDNTFMSSKAGMLAQSVAIRGVSHPSYGVVSADILSQYDNRLDFLLSKHGNSNKDLQSNQTEVMRFLLDLLYVGLRNKDSSIDTVTTAHVQPIVKPILFNMSSGNHYCNQDLNMLECYSMMEKYVSLTSDDELDEFDDLFRFVSDSLGRLKKFLDVKDAHHANLPLKNFKEVYLPEKYDSHGFDVQTEFPKQLENCTGGSFPVTIEYYELASLAELFIKFFAGPNTRGFDRTAFSEKLIKFKNMTDITPIGIGGSSGRRKEIYRPRGLLTNKGLNSVYDSVFSSQIALTRHSIEGLFALCDSMIKGR